MREDGLKSTQPRFITCHVQPGRGLDARRRLGTVTTVYATRRQVRGLYATWRQVRGLDATWRQVGGLDATWTKIGELDST